MCYITLFLYIWLSQEGRYNASDEASTTKLTLVIIQHDALVGTCSTIVHV